MQPVSVSPPFDLARRQNGLADSYHRKRVSLTRNLDEESSSAISRKSRLIYAPEALVRVGSSKKEKDKKRRSARLFIGA